MTPPESLPLALACEITAIPLVEREEHRRVTRDLVASAKDIQESPDGFALQLSADDYDPIVRFIAWER